MEDRIDVILCSFLGGAGLAAIIARRVIKEVISYVLQKYFPERFEEKSDRIVATKNKGDGNETRD